jgi:drug/metabolite transporter (DMT)-like permease
MALLWGVNFSVVKFGTSVIDPLAYNAARLVLAAIVLVVVVALSDAPRPSRATIGSLLALGVLGNGIYQYFFVEGITRTSASDAALVVAASPVFTAIIGKLRGVERIATKGVIGILISVAGIACVVLGTTQSSAGASSLFGDLLVLLGSLGWSIYSVLLKPHTERVTGMQLSAYTMVGGAVPLVIVAWPEISKAHWAALPFAGWSSIVYSGIFSLVVAYYFFYRGIRVIGPTRTTMYSNLQPIIAVLVAWIMLSETPTIWQCLGAAAIMGGLLLTRSRQS